MAVVVLLLMQQIALGIVPARDDNDQGRLRIGLGEVGLV
jgi:hypothetical protein